MPFTLTHTLAVLPFAKLTKKLPLSALAVGSMVPDLSLYINMGPHTASSYQTAHSITGPITIDLFYGLLLFLLFQHLLKAPLISLLPYWVQQRIFEYSRPFSISSVITLVWVMLALVIGAYSHIIWDAFTHHGQWGVTLFPILTDNIPLLSIPAYKAFQHGSSVLGLPILAVLTLIFLRRKKIQTPLSVQTATRKTKRIALGFLLFIPSSILVITFFTHREVHYTLYRTATLSPLILLIMLLLYSIV